MRRWLLLTLSAGCGFQAPGSTVIDPDATAAADSVSVTTDAPNPDAPIDGPTPCGDDDGDGVCNGVDTWPCGPQPPSPGDPVTLDEVQTTNHQTTTVTGASLGTGKLKVVAPGATVTVSASYAVLDCICTGCIDQIQVGLVPGTLKKCIYDGNPPCGSSATGAGNVTLTAPTTPGVYDVRFRIGQDYSCNGNDGTHIGWWVSAPAASTTVAKICVH